MMKTNKLGKYLYNRLPQIYRDYDKDFQLERFLSVLEEGLGYQLKDTEQILNLIDVDKCPNKYLGLISNSLGIVYEPVIPSLYQRRFLKNAIMLNKRKGTISALEYLLRELFENEPSLLIDVENKIIRVSVEYGISDVNAQVEKLGFERILKYYIPVFYELELTFTASAPEANVVITSFMTAGEEITIYPRKV